MPNDLRDFFSRDGSVTVDWQVDDVTGFAGLFNVYVTLENEMSSDVCDGDSSQGETQKFQTEELSYELKNLKSFSQYSIRVTSENDFSVSEFSEKLEFDTKPSKPTQVREVSIVFESIPENDSEVDGILSWKAPCNMNGIFSSYAITVTGKSEEVLIKQTTETENITLSRLNRGIELNITIQANNKEVDGDPVSYSFFTPSGREFAFNCFLEYFF